MLITTDTTREI